MSAFVAAMDSRVTTENGSPAHTTTTSALLNLSFKACRDLDDTSLDSLLAAARAEATTPDQVADLFVLAFFCRSCRGGKGERRLFYRLLLRLGDAYGSDAVTALMPLVPHYGYFKDLLNLIELQPAGPIADAALELYAKALTTDEAEAAKAEEENRTPKLSLAGKYAPRESGSHDRKLGLAAKLALKLNGSTSKPTAQRRYRKLISALNARLKTPEAMMAANRWAEIKFGSVASLCLQRNRKAFLNELVKGKMPHDMEATGNRKPESPGRIACRQNLRAALAVKGIKGKQLGPHEIAAKLMGGRRGSLSTAETDVMVAQWAAMRNGVIEQLEKAAEQRDAEVVLAAAPATAAASDVGGVAAGLGSVAALQKALPKTVDLGRLVALVDVSGSMSGQPMEAAIGLGILVSELAAPAFRDRVLTFETRPSWVDLSTCTNIADKVAVVQSAGWGGSTDFAAACERILAAAEHAKCSPDEVPDLLVLSDMQFDQAGGYCHGGYGYYGSYGHLTPRERAGWETHYEQLECRFAEVGMRICGQPYHVPRIVFWNLRGETPGFPVAKDAPNTQMLSGFSPALLKLVLTGQELVVTEEEMVQPDGTVRIKKSGPTPEQTLRAALDDSAYDAVRRRLSELSSGPLAAYVFTKEEAGFELVAEEAVVDEATATTNPDDEYDMVDCA